MSFLLFFKRLSPNRTFQIAVHCTIAANVFVTVGTWILYCLQCIPIEAYWAPEKHPDVKCLDFGISLWLPASAVSLHSTPFHPSPRSSEFRTTRQPRLRCSSLREVPSSGFPKLIPDISLSLSTGPSSSCR